MELFIYISAALLGATIGSFLNVCIYRLPRPGLSVSQPARSFCPTCGEQIAARDNIPLFSWVWLGGRCRACRSPISSRYFIIEALTAALFLLVARRCLSGVDVVPSLETWGICIALWIFASGLVVAAFVDFDLRQIPDEVTIGGMHLLPLAVCLMPGILTMPVDPSVTYLLQLYEPFARWTQSAINVKAGLPEAMSSGVGTILVLTSIAVIAYLLGCLVYRVYRRRFLPDMPRRWIDVSLAGWLAAFSLVTLTAPLLEPGWLYSDRIYALTAMLTGMLVGSVLVYLVGVFGSKLFRKNAMGFGDVKLMGLLGGLIGWKGAVLGFIVACFLGSVFGIYRLIVYKDRYLPFGPFLILGAILLWFWPEAVQRGLDAYLRAFRI